MRTLIALWKAFNALMTDEQALKEMHAIETRYQEHMKTIRYAKENERRLYNL